MSQLEIGGFPSAWFLNPPETLLCGICYDVLKDPLQCTNSHMHCRSCFEKTVNTSGKCPSCNIKLKLSDLGRCIFVRDQVIAKLPVHCCAHMNEAEKYGCDWVGPLEEALVRKCPLQFCVCENEGCGESILVSNTTRHAAECLKRTVPCELCKKQFKFDSHMQHISYECEYRLISCLCGCSLQLNQLQDHHMNVCPLIEVECPLFAVNLCRKGCTGWITRCDLDCHILIADGSLSETVTSLVKKIVAEKRHSELLSRDVEKLKQQQRHLQSCSKEIGRLGSEVLRLKAEGVKQSERSRLEIQAHLTTLAKNDHDIRELNDHKKHIEYELLFSRREVSKLRIEEQKLTADLKACKSLVSSHKAEMEQLTADRDAKLIEATSRVDSLTGRSTMMENAFRAERRKRQSLEGDLIVAGKQGKLVQQQLASAELRLRDEQRLRLAAEEEVLSLKTSLQSQSSLQLTRVKPFPSPLQPLALEAKFTSTEGSTVPPVRLENEEESVAAICAETNKISVLCPTLRSLPEFETREK